MIEVGFGFLLIASIMIFMSILVGWILGNTASQVSKQKKAGLSRDEFLDALRAHRVERHSDHFNPKPPEQKKDFIDTTGHSVINFDEYRKQREDFTKRNVGWKLVYSEELGRYIKVRRRPGDTD